MSEQVDGTAVNTLYAIAHWAMSEQFNRLIEGGLLAHNFDIGI
jgi:hypothetical protein